MKRTTRNLAGVLVLLLAVAACGGNGDDGDAEGRLTVTGDPNADPASPDFLAIYVPDDLTLPVQRLVDDFVERDPAVQLQLTTGPSGQLRDRIEDLDEPGLYIDTPEEVDQLDGDTGDVVELGEDVVRVVVAVDNPRGVPGVDAFAAEEWTTGLCVSEVLCGALGREFLEDAGVEPDPDRVADSGVTLVHAVADGELDATVAMRSESRMRFRATEALLLVEPGEDEEFELMTTPSVEYAMAPFGSGGATERFVEYVESPDGDRRLQAVGLRSFPTG